MLKHIWYKTILNLSPVSDSQRSQMGSSLIHSACFPPKFHGGLFCSSAEYQTSKQTNQQTEGQGWNLLSDVFHAAWWSGVQPPHPPPQPGCLSLSHSLALEHDGSICQSRTGCREHREKPPPPPPPHPSPASSHHRWNLILWETLNTSLWFLSRIKPTVLPLHRSHRSLLGVLVRKQTRTGKHKHINTVAVCSEWQSYTGFAWEIQIMQSDGKEKGCQTDRPSNEAVSPPPPLSALTASGQRLKQRQDVKLHYVLTPIAVLSRKKEAQQQRGLL